MNFKDIKLGHTLFILDRDSMSLERVTVTNVTAPRVENKVNSLTSLVIDVTVNSGGKSVTYVVPEGTNTSYCGMLIISTEKEMILGEVKAMKLQAEQLLDSIEKTKEKLSKCDDLIAELDDAFREKKETDERLGKLEDMMKNLLETLNKRLTPQQPVTTNLPII